MWYFDMESEEYGEEQFGSYDTKKEAQEGIKRIRAKAKTLNDGVKRFYTEPYKED